MEVTELYELFDPCIDDMFALIIPAFTRFKRSKQYQLIQTYSPPSTTKRMSRSFLNMVPKISFTRSNPIDVEIVDNDEKLMQTVEENNQI